MADSAKFSGDIRVASQIVDYLSSGLYTSPAACLKELINNSYDADATRVDVFVKPDVNTIIVSDDGIGMTRDESSAVMEIVSTKQGSTELLRVEVNFAKMRSADTARRRVSGSNEVIKGDYVGDIERVGKGEHFTQVLLKEIRSGVAWTPSPR